MFEQHCRFQLTRLQDSDGVADFAPASGRVYRLDKRINETAIQQANVWVISGDDMFRLRSRANDCERTMMAKRQPIDTKAKILSDVELWSSIWWLRLSIAASTVKRSFIAKALGLSRPRISQLLSTEGDIQMSTVIKIALSSGYVPHLILEPIDDYVTRKSTGGNITLDHNGAIVNTGTREAKS